MNLLLADSGSTKTDWVLVTEAGQVINHRTQGINPYFQSVEEITKVLRQELTPEILKTPVTQIWFYGAGCATSEKQYQVNVALASLFAAAQIEVSHDMLAAARALCGNQPGIVCILGTGSNSCLYDGKEITDKRPNLGFWLGDEGSGAYIGKLLIIDYLHGDLPKPLQTEFAERYWLTRDEVLHNMYEKPFPNRYAAHFAQFAREKLTHPYIQALIRNSFELFFQKYVLKYEGYENLPISFTGGVAWHYQPILRQIAAKFNMRVAAIAERPIEGLVKYHWATEEHA